MSNWLDAEFGAIQNDGVDLELEGGINFKGGIVATRNTSAGTIDVQVSELPPANIEGGDATGQVLVNGAGNVPEFGVARFVPEDTTLTLDVPADYATLNAALEAIESWYIPASSFVDISIAAGTYTGSTTSVIRHPCAARIRIKGATYLQKTLTSLQSTSGSTGAYSVVLNVSNVTDVSVGDYAIVSPTAGTGPWQIHGGCWEITDVDTTNGRITVTNTAKNAAFPSTTITAGFVQVLRTVLVYNGCDGIRVEGSHLGMLVDVQIVGDRTGAFSGIVASGQDGTSQNVIAAKMTGCGSIVCGQFVGVSGFGEQGVLADNSSAVYARYVASCNNVKRGFYAGVSSEIHARNAIGNGNDKDGVIADYGGTVWGSLGFFCGNGENGGFVFNGGHLVADQAAFSANVQRGVDVRLGVASIDEATCGYNGTGGLLVQNGSQATFVSGVASNNTGPGVEALRGGVLRGNLLTASSNSTIGVYSRLGSYVYATGKTTASNVTADVLAETMGLIEDTTLSSTTHAALFDNRGGDLYCNTLRSYHSAGLEHVGMTCTSIGDGAIQCAGTTRFSWKKDGSAFYPAADGTQNLGRTSERWNRGYLVSLGLGASGATLVLTGTGTPEGAQTAPVGSLYLRTDGGANTTLYVKESGASNTGWVAK